jgi:hypothetical protein
MNQTAAAPAPWVAALWRLLRTALAYAIVYVLDNFVGFLKDLHLPIIILPLISAAINALSKWIRDKWGIDLKVV